MYAIVDCNSFYCSCERVFQPRLSHHAIVVLSNNDGCIISRSDEAKEIGVEMAGPYFKAKPLIDHHGVSVFSSNYNLYGDMSRRVMDTLRMVAGSEHIEVYSVDEAFVQLPFLSDKDLRPFAETMKQTVEQWTGVAVSVGIAPTKTLAKLANSIAKKNKRQTGCIAVLETDEKLGNALRRTPVKEIWGVGSRSVQKLHDIGVYTGWDLSQVPEEWVRKKLGGVVGMRLIKELRGQPAIPMHEYKDKKVIATTRMFGAAVVNLSDIKEAVATYAGRCAEKLRGQHSAAAMVQVFVVSDEPVENASHFTHGHTYSAHMVLPLPTADTNQLIKAATQLAEKIYSSGKKYKKSGVIVSGIVPDDSVQGNLFESGKSIGRMLMEQIDNINFSMRDDIVKFAASGTTRNWKMRKDFQTPRYTTRWNELCLVQ